MKKRILITGGAGFLGKYVCQELKQRGLEPQVFDLQQGQDIMRLEQVKEALANCSACIHLAGVADLYQAQACPERAKKINVEGTRIISQLCKQMNITLLYASTSCVYGNNDTKISSENAPTEPTELYARTKLEGEKIIQKSGGTYHILRLATFYGRGMRSSLAISKFMKKIISGEEVEIHGDGNQTRCYTHVEDIARAIGMVVSHQNAPQCLNIAHPEAYSVNDLLDLIANITGKRPLIKYVPDRPGQIFSGLIDSSAMQKIGWKAKWNLIDGLKNYAQ